MSASFLAVCPRHHKKCRDSRQKLRYNNTFKQDPAFCHSPAASLMVSGYCCPARRLSIIQIRVSATFALIFHGICGTYFVTAGHLLKRIFVTNLLEICTHIPGLCKCVHTEGYCMQTSTKYPPIYPPLTMYSQEGCLVHTYSKYSPTYTYCVLCRIIEHLLQMS